MRRVRDVFVQLGHITALWSLKSSSYYCNRYSSSLALWWDNDQYIGDLLA